MNYAVNFTRVTNSGRLSDRYLTAQAKKPYNEEITIEKGTVFALVEINKPWFPNSQIGQKIINTFIREYHKSSNTSDLVNVELSLKQVNGTLAKITQNGETDWIGNLQAVLAVIHGNALHISQTGKAEAYLFREGKTIKITEGTKQELEPHPLKTFSDISSGSLKLNDKILLASPILFDYFSLEHLRQIITENSPAKAANQLSRHLKKERVRNVNAIIFELTTKEDLTNKTLDEIQETIYLDQKNFNSTFQDTKQKLEEIQSTFKKINSNLVNIYQKIITFSKNHLLPRTKSAWLKTLDFSHQGYKKIKSKTAPAFGKIIKPVQEKIREKIKTTHKEETLLGKTIYNVHHYYKPQKERFGPYLQKTKYFFAKMIKSIFSFLRWFFSKKNRSLLYIFIIIILFLALILSIGKLREKQLAKEVQESAKNTLTEAQGKFDNDFKLAILYNDKNKAKKILEEITQSLAGIKGALDMQEQINDLANKTLLENDKLNFTTRLKDKKIIAEVPQETTKIVEGGDNMFSGSSTNSKILINLITEKTEGKEIVIPQSGGNLQSLAPFGDGKNIVVYTANKEIYKSKSEGNSLEKLTPVEGNWDEASEISVFAGNIYLFNKENGQIYKHNKGSNGYEKSIEFVDTSAVDLKNALSFTIDGAVFVLGDKGQVIKLIKGKPQDFNVREIPSPNDKITIPKKIYTETEINSLYILDDNRILELDKTGKFTAQYVADGLNNIADFAINYQQKKMWFLDSSVIYECNF